MAASELYVLRAHNVQCRNIRCGCGTFVARYQRYADKLPLIHRSFECAFTAEFGHDALFAFHQMAESWLAFDYSGEVVRWGCWLCRNYLRSPGCGEPDMEFCGIASVSAIPNFKLSTLRRHHNCPLHERALAHFLHMPAPSAKNRPPAVEDFKKILLSVHSATSTYQAIDEARKVKSSRMIWALAESLKNIWRQFLHKATTVNILRDERHKRLQLAFRAADSELNVMKGLLGISKTHEGGAIGITDATRQICTHFCTVNYAPPYKNDDCRAPILDQKLLDHIRHITEAITIDSASDELASARDLKSNDHCAAFMPNLRFTLRDKAHASRRFLSRPWAASTYLGSILTVMVSHSGSLVQLVQHSHEFQIWFKELSGMNQSSELAKAFSTFRSAKHRFESLAAPLSRLVLDLGAFIALAVKITIIRKGTGAAQRATEFLKMLCPELVLACAMMADAADEVNTTTTLDTTTTITTTTTFYYYYYYDDYYYYDYHHFYDYYY